MTHATINFIYKYRTKYKNKWHNIQVVQLWSFFFVCRVQQIQ